MRSIQDKADEFIDQTTKIPEPSTQREKLGESTGKHPQRRLLPHTVRMLNKCDAPRVHLLLIPT